MTKAKPAGARSWALARWIGVLALAALAARVGMKSLEARRPAGGSGPAPAQQTRRPVIFIGLEGADWQLLDGYMQKGSMPTLQRLVREGRSGVLATEQPQLSPLLWTTMMTGVSPLEHGILDFTQVDPRTGAREAITSRERRVPAVWSMASATGRRVAVFGLWATYPAEKVDGLMLTDRFFSVERAEQAPAGGLIHPPPRDAWAREARQRVMREVDPAVLRQYVPEIDDAALAAARAGRAPWAQPLGALQRILAETRLYDALARDWLKAEPTDLAIVYLQGTDTIGHVFAPYAPPALPSVPAEDARRFGSVPETYFREIDAMLARYVALAEQRNASLMLASNHGFHWAEGRPRSQSSLGTATAGAWHRDDGLYLLWNTGLPASAGHDGKGAVAQVCATLLALLGEPRPPGIAEPPLGGLGDGAPAGDARAAPVASPSTAPSASGSASTRGPGSYNNEGLILRSRGRNADAERAFVEALRLDPRHASAMANLSDILLARSDLDRADALLLDALRAGLPDAGTEVARRAAAHRREAQGERAVALVAAAVDASPRDAALRLARGRDRLGSGDCKGALADFAEAARLAPADAQAPASSGLARLCLGQKAEAAADFRRSLALDPEQPEVARALERTQ